MDNQSRRLLVLLFTQVISVLFCIIKRDMYSASDELEELKITVTLFENSKGGD